MRRTGGRVPEIVSGRSRCLYTGRIYFLKRLKIPSTGRGSRSAGHRLPPCRGVHACVREMAPVAQGVPALRSSSRSRCGTIVPPLYPLPWNPWQSSFRDQPDDYFFLRFFLEMGRRSSEEDRGADEFSSSLREISRDIGLKRTRETERERGGKEAFGRAQVKRLREGAGGPSDVRRVPRATRLTSKSVAIGEIPAQLRFIVPEDLRRRRNERGVINGRGR